MFFSRSQNIIIDLNIGLLSKVVLIMPSFKKDNTNHAERL